MRSVRVAGLRLHQIASDRFGDTFEGRTGDLVIRAQRAPGPRTDTTWTVVVRDWTPDGWSARFAGRVRATVQADRLRTAALQVRDALSVAGRKAA